MTTIVPWQNCTYYKNPFKSWKEFEKKKQNNIMEAVCLGNRQDIHWFQEQLWPSWLAPGDPHLSCYTKSCILPTALPSASWDS